MSHTFFSVIHYSIRWERISFKNNIIQVRVTFLNESGNVHTLEKYYEEWLGVVTNNIERVVDDIKCHFPGSRVLYQEIGQVKKILPYFEDRLAKGKLEYRSKPFYKVYTSSPIKHVGRYFNRNKIGYYDPEDWLTRIYIDLCTKFNTTSFYYRWYQLHDSFPSLMESLTMIPDRNDQPDWTFAAFDIESVPLQGNHIPMGHNPSDRIVMISVFKWNRMQGVRSWLLYLLPETVDDVLPGYEHGFRTESELLIQFHELLEDVSIITGYNINAFDFPCIFARLVFLKLYSVLKFYTSTNVGTDLIVSYKHKITIDLYSYFKIFSGYNLPSFKLDDVARIKLEGETKLPVKATGIWSWYRSPVSVPLLLEESAERCFEIMRPETVSRAQDFGTFRTYMNYCLKDSELVYRLFEKEYVISFLVERANFTALNVTEALHLGNSRYLLELFKTYGTRLGFFINPKFFRTDDLKNQQLLGSKRTYQGALNYCIPERVYEDVSVMDFASMYPSTLLSSNLCYGTCTIMHRDEYMSTDSVHALTCIPYRFHNFTDFQKCVDPGSKFFYPPFDPEVDEYVIIINQSTEAFLPSIVSHFIVMRQHHQKEWNKTQDIYHYNVQLGIKILINSLYGVMANKDSPLTYLPIAIIIVTLSRYQLLGSYHFLKNEGYQVCYADTDSLMVCRYPHDHCDEVNAYLSLKSVELKYEQRFKRLLVLSKKRYVYQRADDVIVTKGFQKRVNGLIEFMSDTILSHVWRALFGGGGVPDPSDGWIVYVSTLLEAAFRCRDPKKYSIYRKIKKLDEYISNSCPAVKYLRKYPDRTDEHVEFTYSRADVAASEASNWVMDVEDCEWVNYEQLFVSQKKIFCMLLNMAYWHLPDPTFMADMVLNAIHWKRFVHAELLHWHATGGVAICMLVEPGVKYTFTMNDHLQKERRKGRKRKVVLE